MKRVPGGWLSKATMTLAIIVLIGLFAVNIMGFTDTDTHSALGCGHDWPLCNGVVFPHVWGLKTLIEFSHRALVGVVTILLLILSALALALYWSWKEIRWLVLISVVFVFIEGALGAIGVIFSDPAWFLATHFGVSLIAFNGVLLLVTTIFQVERQWKRVGEFRPLERSLPDRRMLTWTWFSIGYTYIAMYVGAFVSATDSGIYFQGFPIPEESYQAAHMAFVLDVLHRSIALGLILLIVRLVVFGTRMRQERRDLFYGSFVALLFVALQAVSGALLIATHLSIPAFLLHVSVITGLFGALCFLGLQVLPQYRKR